MTIRLFRILVVTFLFSTPLAAMVSDNRYFPFFQHPFSRIAEKPSHFTVDPFFTTASVAYDNKENEIEIPALFGQYDQSKLSEALNLVGKDNPLPGEFRGPEILWKIFNKIQGQGIALSHEQSLFSSIFVGYSWFLMHVHSRFDWCLDRTGRTMQEGDIEEIKRARRLMHEELGICQMQSSFTGMGDFDCYIRLGSIWDYAWKCRRIDAGFRLGLMMPSGVSRDIYNPTTVPLGGNGHWGAYLRADAEFELKEDMKFGLSCRVSKRFNKIYDMRLPVAKEHPLFGALVTPVRVDPGATFSFYPYVSLENLREGFGVRVGLHLNKHLEDSFGDLRSSKEKQDLPADTAVLRKYSEWASDYASLSAFYDFGKMDVERGYKPILTFTWDFPFLMFISSNVVRTNRITLGIEVNF